MTLKSFLKALFIPFQRGSADTTAPFFGNNFELWEAFTNTPRGSSIDFNAELGDLRGSALLMAAHTWLSAGLSAPRLTVVQIGNDNEETEIQNHPLVELIEKPNPYYGSEELLSGIALDWLVAATAYVIKIRNAAGGIGELWYEPWQTIRPTWPKDGSKFISGYEIQRNGNWRPIPFEDVFVLRKGPIDPVTRMGQSPTQALMREYYTDRQAAEFGALLMKQGLVPPLIVSLGNGDTDVSIPEMDAFKKRLMEIMGGSKAGGPAVVNIPAKVDLLNFDYSKIGLREVRGITEERFCAAMGISAYSLHFGISRDASTYSNVANYLRQDYQAYIAPLQKYIAKRLTAELLPEFDSTPDREVHWNYEQVALMLPDVTEEWKRIGEAYKARLLDQAEAREAIGYKSDKTHEGVYYPIQTGTTTTNRLTLDPSMLTAFANMVAADELPLETLWALLEKAELLPPGFSKEKAQRMIEDATAKRANAPRLLSEGDRVPPSDEEPMTATGVQ